MSKIFNHYEDKVDKAWYKSSNIKYSECIDNENELKTLKVVFSKGTQYQYEKIPVTEYLMFREAESQGKALNKIIKAGGYEYQKLDNADLDEIDNDYEFLTGDGLIICNDGSFTVKNTHGEVLYERPDTVSEETLSVLENVLRNVGHKVRKNKD